MWTNPGWRPHSLMMNKETSTVKPSKLRKGVWVSLALVATGLVNAGCREAVVRGVADGIAEGVAGVIAGLFGIALPGTRE